VRIEGARRRVGSEEAAQRLAVLDRRTVDGRVEVFQVGLVVYVEQSQSEQGAGQQRNDDERQRTARHAAAVPREDVAKELLHVLVEGAHRPRDDVTVTSRLGKT